MHLQAFDALYYLENREQIEAITTAFNVLYERSIDIEQQVYTHMFHPQNEKES